MISAACEKMMDELLREHLIVPMGFGSVARNRCPAGFLMGAPGLYASAGYIVRLGRFYLHGGIFGGKRLLSSIWAKQAIDRGCVFKLMYGTYLIGKGGINCHMVLFSSKSCFAAAWHAYNINGSAQKMIAWMAGQ